MHITPNDINYSIPTVSFSPTSFTLFDKYLGEGSRKNIADSSLKNLKNNQHRGTLSIPAQRRLRKTIGWFLLKVRNKWRTKANPNPDISKKIGFVTLTLPSTQIHSDNVIKANCLNHFLIELSSKFGVKDYVWRAEKQKNGNIHFHILIDKWIPYLSIRKIWNRITDKLDYVKEFAKKHNHSNPNSTDVHNLKKVKNIYNYISKYCSKVNDSQAIQGRIWFASSSLSNISNLTTDIDCELHFEIKKIIELHQPHIIKDEHFVVVCLAVPYIDLSPFPSLSFLVDEHLRRFNLN